MKNLFAFLIMPVSYIVRGLVLKVLWGWFFVTTFSMPPITIPVALGLSTTVGFLTAHYDPDAAKKPEDERMSALFTVAVSILTSLMTLAIGAIIHAFM